MQQAKNPRQRGAAPQSGDAETCQELRPMTPTLAALAAGRARPPLRLRLEAPHRPHRLGAGRLRAAQTPRPGPHHRVDRKIRRRRWADVQLPHDGLIANNSYSDAACPNGWAIRSSRGACCGTARSSRCRRRGRARRCGSTSRARSATRRCGSTARSPRSTTAGTRRSACASTTSPRSRTARNRPSPSTSIPTMATSAAARAARAGGTRAAVLPRPPRARTPRPHRAGRPLRVLKRQPRERRRRGVGDRPRLRRRRQHRRRRRRRLRQLLDRRARRRGRRAAAARRAALHRRRRLRRRARHDRRRGAAPLVVGVPYALSVSAAVGACGGDDVPVGAGVPVVVGGGGRRAHGAARLPHAALRRRRRLLLERGALQGAWPRNSAQFCRNSAQFGRNFCATL